MLGQTIAHYRILEKLGAGGMGEVYLADDTNLDRKVALKFLPDSLRRDPESRERLLREARAASQLSHPNILTVHAVEHAGDRDFIVMEYIAGEPLDRYVRTRNLSLNDIIDISIQIADGLAKAHQSGIVHRDLKPANILVDADGRPKILDFGLAKIRGAAKLTQTGSTTGTAAYMSPEQAQGKEVDHRSDLFSFGAVLYEMIAGRPPFAGDHHAAIAYAIVNDPAEPIARYKTGTSDELQRVVSKCLAKSPEERYQSAADLSADLRTLKSTSAVSSRPIAASHRRRSLLIPVVAITAVAVIAIAVAMIWQRSAPPTGQSDSSRKMLAVLPFENLGPADQEYFADGMTEEITARLAGVKDLGVIARTSILQYKGTTKPLDQIGKELGVDYILEGTVRWQKSTTGPDQVRITPQLVRVSDATHVWADVFDAVLDEVFTVQSSVARKVVDALNVSLAGSAQQTLEARPTANMQAYDIYLRGREYFHQSLGGTNERALRLAVQVYEQAVAADSTFALAWAALSQIYTELYWHQDQKPDLLASSIDAMERARRLAPDLPDVRIAKGSILYHAGKYDEALTEFAIVEAQQPNNSDLLMEIAFIHRRRGEVDKAVARFLQVAALDPQSDRGLAEAGVTTLWNHDYGRAAELLSGALRLTPDCSQCWIDLAESIVFQTGDAQRALDTLVGAGSSLERDGDYYQATARLSLWAGDYEMAANFASQGDGSNYPAGRYLLRADALMLQGDSGKARVLYDSARVYLDGDVHTDPDTKLLAQTHALAGLGLVKEARAQVDSLANSLESKKRMYWMASTALPSVNIYVRLGDYGRALDILEQQFDPPSFINEHVLRLEPRLKPLHNEPRFQALLNRQKKSPS